MVGFNFSSICESDVYKEDTKGHDYIYESLLNPLLCYKKLLKTEAMTLSPQPGKKEFSYAGYPSLTGNTDK